MECKPTIQQFMKENSIGNNDLQTYFNMKLIPMLKKHDKKLMGWEE
jgi:hexosaminidase